MKIKIKYKVDFIFNQTCTKKNYKQQKLLGRYIRYLPTFIGQTELSFRQNPSFYPFLYYLSLLVKTKQVGS